MPAPSFKTGTGPFALPQGEQAATCRSTSRDAPTHGRVPVVSSSLLRSTCYLGEARRDAPACEASAAKASRARIACAEHHKRTRVPENLGASAAHFVMLPTTPLRLGRAPASASSQVQWEALCHATQHYMYLLLSCSSSSP